MFRPRTKSVDIAGTVEDFIDVVERFLPLLGQTIDRS